MSGIAVGSRAGAPRADQRSAALIVAYNRVPSRLLVETALLENTIVVIVDNSNSPSSSEEIAALSRGFPRLMILGGRGNIGVSRALNWGATVARHSSCEWLHTLDDDARVPKGFFRAQRDGFCEVADAGVPIGATGPVVTDDAPKRGLPRLQGAWTLVSSLITSGTLTTQTTLDRVGGYNESLFVEGVDLDFSERVQRCGLRLARLNGLVLQQPFGYARAPTSWRARWVDRAVSATSTLSLLARRSNSYHTRYSYYPTSRRSEYWKSFRVRHRTDRGVSGLLASVASESYMVASAILDYAATGDRNYVTTCLG
jgi:hypothetical protein